MHCECMWVDIPLPSCLFSQCESGVSQAVSTALTQSNEVSQVPSAALLGEGSELPFCSKPQETKAD